LLALRDGFVVIVTLVAWIRSPCTQWSVVGDRSAVEELRRDGLRRDVVFGE
jgi:hypothetical protein